MVIWVFAGGGEAEVEGLIKFLSRNFPNCQFERYTPIRKKPGPKPNKKPVGYGYTGQSLIAQIREQLAIAFRYNSCDLILIFDDLDCRDPEQQREKIRQGISDIPECNNVNTFVGFAAPEIEAWLIADWDNSVGKHPDFRSRHQRMRHWLSTHRKIPFNAPESFSDYDPQRDCCREKLSDTLIESTQFAEDRVANLPIYSKSYHTPNLLLMIEGRIVQQKCPLFRQLYHSLNNLA